MPEESRGEGLSPASITPVPPALSLECSPHQPDGGFGLLGAVMLFVLVTLAGVGLGWLASWASQYFYLILLFSVIIGGVLGVVEGLGIMVGKIRNPLLGGVAGFCGGCVAMIALQYFDYERFQVRWEEHRAEILQQQEFLKQFANAPGKQKILATVKGKLKQIELAQLREENRHNVAALNVSNLLEYVDFMAHEGVELGRLGRGGSFNLGYYGTYIYWIVEVLLVAGVAGYLGQGFASAPFCTRCQSWKESRKFGTLKPRVAQNVEDAQKALEAGAVSRLLEFGPSREGGPLILTASVCPKCAGESAIAVKLEHCTTDDKGKETTQELAHVTYPGAALRVLEAIFQTEPQQSAATPRDEALPKPG